MLKYYKGCHVTQCLCTAAQFNNSFNIKLQTCKCAESSGNVKFHL